MDIVEFIIISIGIAVGVVSLVVELFRHAPVGKALLFAVGNGFIAFIIVAFGSSLFVGIAAAIANRSHKERYSRGELKWKHSPN